jgi:antitoxin component HigA of HigAB toxin-antitoxin module
MTKPDSVTALETWLDQSGRKKGWLAKTIGSHPASISRWMNGSIRPNRSTREAIERLTDGDVPANGWGDAR